MGSKEVKVKNLVGVYVTPLEDGSNTFRINYKHPIEKKLKWLTIGNSKDGFNATYAKNKRSEIIAICRMGDDPNIPILKAKQHKTTFNDLADNYLINLFDTKGSTRSTKQSKSRYNSYLAPTIGDLQLTQLTKQHAKKIQSSLTKRGLAPRTVNHIVTLISTIINYNIKNDVVKGSNPLKGIEQLKADSERTRYLTKEEVSELLEHTKDDKTLHLFTLLALSTGARLNGVLSIQKKDINLKNNTVKLQDLKSGGTYQGFTKADVKDLLQEAMKTLEPNSYVVNYKDGERLEDKRIQRPLKPILDKLFNKDLDKDNTLDRAVVHTLRHTFASLLAINDVSIYKIMKLMNHKDIKMTMRYAKLAPDSGQSDINNLF